MHAGGVRLNTFHLKVVAYNRVFFDGQAVSINVPAIDGNYQLLSMHEDVVVAIVPGDFEIIDADGNHIHAVCGTGYLQFDNDPNEGELLVDTIERPEEIDVRWAREAKERAEEELRQKRSILEHHASQAALARAMARLKEAGKYRGNI